MPIFLIKPDHSTLQNSSWHITPEIISSFPIINNYSAEINRLKKNTHSLLDISVEEFLDFFDALTEHWISNPSNILNKYASLGISFLIPFLKRSNLSRLIKSALYGNTAFLDTFVEMKELGKKIMAHPRGLITHWLAGNIPMLGMISLVQGIISKNSNVVKLPLENGLVLPALFADVNHFVSSFNSKKSHLWKNILESILFVYCEKENMEGQQMLSIHSDVRVAWGGKRAVEQVLSLPKKHTADDLIFGPCSSFAVIGRNSFDIKNLENIALKLALDTSMFDQQACSSPHTVLVEKGGQVSPYDFAQALAVGMQKACRRIPKQPVSADEAYTVVNTRSEYSFSGEVFSSQGTEWTVIYSEEKGLADPCYSRVVFVRPIDDINEVVPLVNQNHQTLGLLLDDRRKVSFAKKITAKGIDRISDLGKMNLYDYPWDGVFPISRYIRWVSMD